MKKLIICSLVLTLCVQLATPIFATESTSAPISSERIEEKYAANGPYNVTSVNYECDEEDYSQYRIWYPSVIADANDTQVFPVVVFANGTGVTYENNPQYDAVCQHLATWGFICVSNNDPESWKGDSTSKSLEYMKSMADDSKSIFYGKVDTNNAGISGHSQGGVGAFNAAMNYDNSHCFKTVFAASATGQTLAGNLHWSYNPAGLTIPCFLIAATGLFDSGIVTTIESMYQNYDSLSSVIMGRRKEADHPDTLTIADGYMTAWFCYTLQQDITAAGAFTSDSAQFLSDPNWQDQKAKNLPTIQVPQPPAPKEEPPVVWPWILGGTCVIIAVFATGITVYKLRRKNR